jgi:hypothetical protein
VLLRSMTDQVSLPMRCLDCTRILNN